MAAADDQMFPLLGPAMLSNSLLCLSRLSPAPAMFPARCLISRLSGCERGMQTAVATGERPAKSSLSSSPSSSSPLHERDFFAVRNCFTMKEMFDARVHLGHKEGTLNPQMRQYVLGSRLKSLIIDLDQTTRLLGDALNFTAHIAARRGIILIVNRSRQTGHLAEKLAHEVGEYAHTHDWPKDTFLNSTAFFGATTRLPDLCIFLSCLDNVFDNHRAVADSNRLLIPSIGIVDTPSDPSLITFPVPGNDDTPCAIEFYCRVFKKAITAGKEYAKTLPANA